MDNSRRLPSFTDPPVVEVVVGVQFGRIDTLRSIHFGLWWQQVKEIYPRWSEQPALEPRLEIFGNHHLNPIMPAFPQGLFANLQATPPVRLWLESSDEQWLVQLQPDRLIFNWRSQDSRFAYPRYHEVRERFVSVFGNLQSYLSEAGLGILDVIQCEVMYVNLIRPTGSLDSVGKLGEVLKLVSPAIGISESLEPETFATQVQYVADAGKGRLARLYVEANPVIRPVDGDKAIQITITARGRPADGSRDAALAMLDCEHEMVVRTFTNVTTSHMHEAWGITNG